MATGPHTASDGRQYVVVEKGDSLWAIAQKHLGGGANYPQLMTINGLSSTLIHPGKILYLSASTSGGGNTSTAVTNKAVITDFGLRSDVDDELYATWSWTYNGSKTEKYEVVWSYNTADGIVMIARDTSTTYCYDTCKVPEGAIKVQFKVRPISVTWEEETSNGKKTTKKHFTADWTDRDDCIFYTKHLPPDPPSLPSITLDGLKFTAELNNVASDISAIFFQLVKDNSTVVGKANGDKATVKTGHASYTWNVEAGHKYKVRCRAMRNGVYSEWTDDYTSNVETMPASPSGITVLRANSKYSVYLEWSSVATAESYEVEYTNKQSYFDISNQTTPITDIKTTEYIIDGLDSGEEYFFRVRAVKGEEKSGWTAIKSVKLGEAPAAPTTWSSSTTVIVGEPVTLYWVHNSKDGSKQTKAWIELDIGGSIQTIEPTIKVAGEDEEEETSSYVLQTSSYTVGTTIKWRVKTRGITVDESEWSTKRTIDVYAPPTLQMDLTNQNGDSIDTITSFPVIVTAIPGPPTQVPTGYHVSITSNEYYETVDILGNPKIISEGQEIYSKYFDTFESLYLMLSAGNIDLENGIDYTITCTVSMNSGLTAESSIEFHVSWTESTYAPNAEIGIDEDVYSAVIRPYCEEITNAFYKVERNGRTYTKTNETLAWLYGELVAGATTTTGEEVYQGTTAEGDQVYYCEVQTSTMVEGITLAVYRKEFDGSFVEIGSGLENTKYTYITDPHPALDYARYRIVATETATGAVSFYDVPNYYVGGKAAIIQWDEDWSTFDTAGADDPLAEPSWTGSLLKLPYNIDVSDKNSPDVSLVNYIGRKRPVSYYGTQLNESQTWNVTVPKDDEETVYALRRLQNWMGDVYVREPSGSGYWANITVSFSQKHCDMTIPVTIEINRVEGGV